MLNSSLKSQFDDDPFFSMHQERLRGADEIFSSFFNHDPFLSLTNDGSQPQRHRARDRGQGRSHDHDFDGSMDLMMARNPFDSMNSMMRNMHNMMGGLSQQMIGTQNDANANVYSQSSVMSFANVGNGQRPKVYQATTATRQMPGGLRETRRAVRDSEAGLEKMAIGRHINDRGNVVTRQRNARTGDMDENREFVNMGEEDKPQFDNEWQEKTNNYYSSSSNHARNAINGQQQQQRQQQQQQRQQRDNGKTRHRDVVPPSAIALEAASPRDKGRHHQRHGKQK